jgi:hypothetical protein
LRRFQRGDIVYFTSAIGNNWIGIVTTGEVSKNGAIYVNWFRSNKGEFIEGGVALVGRLTLIGPMPEGVEWDVEW